MEYNIDKMQEKEIIELMLMLHDKLSVNIMDEKAAEQRLVEIENEEKESKDTKIIEIYENSGLTEEDLFRILELKQKKRKEEENKKLEAIARKNSKAIHTASKSSRGF